MGAGTINQSITAKMDTIAKSGIQVIWQTGKFYIEKVRHEAEKHISSSFIVTDFVSRMDYAYSIADLVVSRAGASSISELCLLAKPVVLVPSPNVAEDHQTKNALALVNKNAAVMVRDSEAIEKLVPAALDLILNDKQMTDLSKNIVLLAQKDSANRIVDEVFNIIKLK